MADETQHAAAGAAVENPDLRRQLIKRLTVAGGLVALLLALLALFDHLSQPVEEVEVSEFTEAVPVAPKKVLTQPVSAPPEEATEAAETVVEEAAPPPPPAIAATPEHVPEEAAASAASPKPAGKKAATPAVVPEGTFAPPIVADLPAREQTRAQLPARAHSQGAAANGPARVPELTPPPARPSRQVDGFLLQAGVFASAERAEELHAKLTLSGIPTQIETRVQVGPFRTRQEALAAQAKLKALGIDSLLVMPKGSR